MESNTAGWLDRTTKELCGFRVTMSEPVLVRQSRRYCWFPTVFRMSNGDLWAVMSPIADSEAPTTPVLCSRSKDGGCTWDEPRLLMDAGTSFVALPDGRAVMLPYYMRPRPGGMGATCNVLQPDGAIPWKRQSLTVTGWPRPDKSFDPEQGLSGFVFNGQTTMLAGEVHGATLYGRFVGDTRYSLLLAESSDGFAWRIRATIAGSDCQLKGDEGPCESALCRVADGRLMCIFRNSSFVPYGQAWSSDEGYTWSAPTSMPIMSVEPSVAVLPGGTIALSGGRPGLFVWFNFDGRGSDWQAMDIVDHHNRCRPDDIIKEPTKDGNFTSCYTELALIDSNNLLLIYDQLGYGWAAIPDEKQVTNRVWVIRLTVMPK